MVITIHRGTRQIGGTCIEIASNNESILLDIGLPLDSNDILQSLHFEIKENPKTLVDNALLPDIPGIYTWDNRKPRIQAIIVSHPHLDHYGVLEFIKPEIPVIMGMKAWQIIYRAEKFISNRNLQYRPEKYFKSGSPMTVGSFIVTPYLMDHSAFDSYAVHLSDSARSVIYTGDFRNHGRKKEAFEYFLKHSPRNADALIIEGTMLSRISEDVVCESTIEEKIKEVCHSTANLVMGYCSGQNIDRIVSFYRAAKKSGRMLVVDIYTAHILKVAGETAKIPVPGKFSAVKVYYPRRLSTKVANAGNVQLLYEFQPFKIVRNEISENREKILMLVRPSVKSELGKIDNLDGSKLIYSMWSGYRSQPYVSNFIEWLQSNGCQIIDIHTSGHATLETLRQVIENIRPVSIIPVHTEKPEIYAKLFQNTILTKDKVPLTI